MTLYRVSSELLHKFCNAENKKIQISTSICEQNSKTIMKKMLNTCELKEGDYFDRERKVVISPLVTIVAVIPINRVPCNWGDLFEGNILHREIERFCQETIFSFGTIPEVQGI